MINASLVKRGTIRVSLRKIPVDEEEKDAPGILLNAYKYIFVKHICKIDIVRNKYIELKGFILTF